MKHDVGHVILPSRPARLTPPPERQRLALPQLWETAKALFARVIEAVGGTERLHQAKRLLRHERAEILAWLEPVERLARAVLFTRAITCLLMSPEDRKRMTTAQACAAKPGWVSTRIPYPGWHTLARYWQPPPAPPSPSAPKPSSSGRVQAFQVLRRPQPAGRAPQLVIDLWKPAPARPLPGGGRQTTSGPRPSPLQRRIEALARALAKPEPIVRRLARSLAKRPELLLQPHGLAGAIPSAWRCGYSEITDSSVHLVRAVGTLHRLEPG